MYLVPQLKGEEKLEYLRKSQTDDPLLSVEEVLQGHERRLDEWNERMQPEGGPVPEENRYREIVSGETIAGRPKMLELLRRVESPKIKAVMCVEPSRLSRGSLKDIGYLVEILRYSNTLVITPEYVFDLNDPGDRDRFERELMRGNDYLEYTKKIRHNGRITKVKMGHFIGNCAPYGYRKTVIQEGKMKCHTLEPIPEQAAVVQRIFQMYRDGLGADRIADVLNAEHIPAPKGKRWVRESFYQMLDNVHYLGKVKWNERKAVRTVEDGEVKVSRPRAEEFLVFEGKHPAIIDQELWDAVQAVRGSHPRNPNARNLTNPLAGLLWCHCGRAMVGRRYNGPDGEARCASRFLCINRKHCRTASARMQDVLDEVAKALREAIADFEIRIEAGTDDSAEIHRQLVTRLERRLAELEELESKQWDEKIKGEIPAHVFKKLNDQTVEEIEDIKHALCEAKNAVPEPIDLQAKIITFRAALAAMERPDAPVKEVNQLLKACIERITYSREKYTEAGPGRAEDATPIQLHIELRV